MDCSLPGSSVHGIFQARVLEWDAIAFSANSARNVKWYKLLQKQYRDSSKKIKNILAPLRARPGVPSSSFDPTYLRSPPERGALTLREQASFVTRLWPLEGEDTIPALSLRIAPRRASASPDGSSAPRSPLPHSRSRTSRAPSSDLLTRLSFPRRLHPREDRPRAVCVCPGDLGGDAGALLWIFL